MQPRRFNWLAPAVALLMTVPLGADAAQQGRAGQRMRFRGMDTDGDGVITRAEWRGSAQAFDQNDTNRDGVLSGDEVWVPARGRGQAGQGVAENEALVRVFQNADRNRDGVLSRSEWYSDEGTFRRLDRDLSGTISRREFLREDAVAGTTGVVPFDSLDRNGDGRLSIQEWGGSVAAFERLDRNADGVVTRDEYSEASAVRETPAYRAGYDRGLTEGRQAGREDKQLRNQWDLEGQRELEQADSGYQPSFGPRNEYQAGYRAGFRLGYRQGFGPRS